MNNELIEKIRNDYLEDFNKKNGFRNGSKFGYAHFDRYLLKMLKDYLETGEGPESIEEKYPHPGARDDYALMLEMVKKY
jgi:hypothetical protein